MDNFQFDIFSNDGEEDETCIPKPKHKLHSNWTTWVRDRQKSRETQFEDSIRKLFIADTAESFFEHYVHMKRPDEIISDIDIFMFRETEMPMWEESPNGGTLIVKLKRDHPCINLYWERLMLMCIGEGLGDTNLIGVALSLRRNNCALLEVWVKTATKKASKYR